MQILTRSLLSLCFGLLLSSWTPAHSAGLQLNMGLPHYAQEMEFYYLRPHPEGLARLLGALESNGVLATAENRLMTAAFFAQLMRNRAVELAPLAEACRDREGMHTLAWAVHLAGSQDERLLLDTITQKGDRTLAAQIKRAPADLAAWAPAKEFSTLLMFLGAFMATGNEKWLDPIISAALARPGAHSLSRLSGQAAALLYEYAPRHAAISRRVAFFQSKGNPDPVLQTILEHAPVK